MSVESSTVETSVSPSPPTISVIMGVYNSQSHLAQSIESILSQSFTDYEFLIMDDGSTDRSRSIIDAYAGRDSRIRVFANDENRGLGFVLNQGVRLAAGEFVARMDADDFSVPQRFEKQVAALREDPSMDILGSYALDVDENGRILRERKVPVSHERIVKLIWSCPMIHPTVMFRRARILGIGSYSPDIRRRQDYELWFRCVQAGLRFANLPEGLVHYRFSRETLKRNDIPSMFAQVKMGLKGCRMIGAPPLAYAAVSMPLVEAIVPDWIRLRLHGIKKKLDPRRSGP